MEHWIAPFIFGFIAGVIYMAVCTHRERKAREKEKEEAVPSEVTHATPLARSPRHAAALSPSPS